MKYGPTLSRPKFFLDLPRGLGHGEKGREVKGLIEFNTYLFTLFPHKLCYRILRPSRGFGYTRSDML